MKRAIHKHFSSHTLTLFYLKSLFIPPYLNIHAPCFHFFSSFIMAFKISQLIHILLWLSLLFLLFHEYYNLKYSKINKKYIIQATHHSLSSHHSRKVLARKFHFSPFFKHHHHQVEKDPSDTKIDPRYGVEKRRVPTGPNPLHH